MALRLLPTGSAMAEVRLGQLVVGNGHPCAVVAEIGINHNGDLRLAKKLINVAAAAGCSAVKFQKRTIDVVYSVEELAKPRESPFGETNGDLKRHLEFGLEEYREIDRYCRELGMVWYSSCWDEASVDFIEQFTPPCYKIASACLTDENLLRHHKATGRPLILSTGMSTMEQVRKAVNILGTRDLVLLHTASTYPSQPSELNLRVILQLKELFPVPIGYSGHEVGLSPTLAAVTLGACMVERHITLDRASWGSDQAASVEPQGITRLVKDIRVIESALGDGMKRVLPSEIPVMKKLRRVG
jgi:N-acetylneuraminate synthase